MGSDVRPTDSPYHGSTICQNWVNFAYLEVRSTRRAERSPSRVFAVRQDPIGSILEPGVLVQERVLQDPLAGRIRLLSQRLGAQEQQKDQAQQAAPAELDFFRNVRGFNKSMQQERGKVFKEELNKTREGIQAQQAK